MGINYFYFALIALLPLIIAFFWFHPAFFVQKYFNSGAIFQKNKLSLGKILMLYLLSVLLIYGYMNLIIHQLGFYELFFTDIMKGSGEAQIIVDNFLAKYGDKYRTFKHGLFHGIINTFIVALPFIGIITILESKPISYLFNYMGYWLATSMIVGGLISAFI